MYNPMYRIQEKRLESWFTQRVPKPLIIRGARQVGKSTLVRQFCKSKKIKLYELNLEKHGELSQIFATNDVKKVVEAIEDILQVKIGRAPESLLFLDEIQAIPSAISCLRYFYEDLPGLAVIAAGSLLEFVLNDHAYSTPVGRIEYLHMGPMNFNEFLLAKQENYFFEKLNRISSVLEIGETYHKKGLDLLREYFFIGGMPEAIATAISSGIESVPAVHASILQTYQEDFVKYSKRNHLQKIQKVFKYCFMNPCQKVKYSNISSEDLSRDLKTCIHLLTQAKITSPVNHSPCSGLPLEANEAEEVYKLLALDVGLVNHAQGIKWATFKNFGENEILVEGLIAEQFVGQQLLYLTEDFIVPKLNYWLREGKSNNAEVDFVVERGGFLIAIEVKAGVAGKIRSLHQWMKDVNYKKKKAIRFNLSAGAIEGVTHHFEDEDVKYKLVTLPLYLVNHFHKFI